MTYYIKENDEILIYDDDLKRLELTAQRLSLKGDFEIKKVQKGYVIYNGELMSLSEAEKLKEKENRQKLDSLSLTRADVERAIYKSKGIDFEDLINQIETLKQVQGDKLDIDLKALKIELKANNFYRGNPWINQIGALLGFNQTQLDNFFKTGDWEELIGN